ncbi:MAG: aminotransferase class III-fold pyridoxal phosphate-dependent enzyme [Candidatus Vogelbacteria bacterium]|nr:aminotransferase class III-fold pyridoxal phosphate-dependent enzyme [Candidatus Vogelbacteria bacterium]
MSDVNTVLTPQEIYELGERVSTKTTIDSDLVPSFGVGPKLFGTLANEDKSVSLLDFCCGIGVNPLGYSGQLKMLPGNEWHNWAAVLLKRKLCQIAPVPQPSKVFLSNSGAEAVEAAIKMCQARRYREAMVVKSKREQKHMLKKNVFGAFGGAFHGRTQGALSLNCSKKKHTEAFFADRGDMSDDGRIKNRAIPVCHIPFPENDNQKSIDRFYEVLKTIDWSRMSAFFFELIQGEGGIRLIDANALMNIVQLCYRNGVYVIVDEVQTGMMRTGRMFATEYFDYTGIRGLDILCLSKALGGGQAAVGATICKAEFDFTEAGQHSNTFGGSPLPSALALENIEKLEALDRKELAERIKILEEFAPEGLGLMRRIVFSTAEIRNKICDLALHRGLLVIPAGERAIRLMPPINIPLKDLKTGIDILKSCINEVVK